MLQSRFLSSCRIGATHPMSSRAIKWLTGRTLPTFASALQDMTLVDGAGSKPAYNLRTLSRALQYARAALPQYGLQRALYDGCAMAFLTQLHPSSAPAMERLLQSHILSGTSLKARSCVILETHACRLQHIMELHTILPEFCQTCRLKGGKHLVL